MDARWVVSCCLARAPTGSWGYRPSAKGVTIVLTSAAADLQTPAVAHQLPCELVAAARHQLLLLTSTGEVIMDRAYSPHGI